MTGATTSNAPVATDVNALVPDDGVKRHDFGRVLEGEKVQHEFILRNTTAAPLAVTHISTSCRCSVGDLDSIRSDGSRLTYELGRPIPAGESIAVRAGLVTHQQQGRIQHSVALVLSIGGATRLDLSADVVPFFETEPPRGTIQIGNLRKDEQRAGSLIVRTGDGRPVALSIDASEVSPLVVATLEPLSPDDRGRSAAWRLDVLVGPLPEVSTVPLSFVLYSDVERPDAEPDDVPRHRVHYQRVVIGASLLPSVKVTPSHAAFGIFTPGVAVKQAFEVEITDDHVSATDPVVTFEFTLTKADPALLAKKLTTTVRALDEGTNWRVEIELAALSEELAGSIQGVFIVQLDHPTRPEVRVPFSGLCNAPRTK